MKLKTYLYKVIPILLGMTLLLGALAPMPVKAINIWQVYADAKAAKENKQYARAIELFSQLVPEFKSEGSNTNVALMYNNMADCQIELGQVDEAVHSWEQEAIYWGYDGAVQEQVAANRRANLARSTIELYTEVSSGAAVDSLYHHAKYEPMVGAYLGAYAELDEKVHNPMTGKPFYTEGMTDLTGKKHASFLLYSMWGTPFTTYSGHVRKAKEAGTALQIALQPIKGLEAVQDDSYLRTYAKEVQKAGIPVFLRFANEMNGNWTEWYGNPQLYIEKFRLVSKVFKEEAPNAVLVWSPNYFPVDNIEDYYPGDDYVDWVGVSMYHSPTPSLDPLGKGVDRVSYVEKLDQVYKLYSDRKPIMISEGAVAYTSSDEGNKDVTPWAVANIRQFYASLAMKYPKIKAVYWFNNNVDTGTIKNYYKLSSNQPFLNAYKSAIQNSFYLSNIGDKSPITYLPASAGIAPRKVKLQSYVKTFDPEITKVRYSVNGKEIGTALQPPYALEYNFLPYRSQEVTIQVDAFEKSGRVVTKKFTATVGSGNVQFNGETVDFDSQPQIHKARMYVPIRQLIDSLDAKVGWNGETSTVTISKDGQKLELKIGSTTAYKNGQPFKLEAAPYLRNKRTYVPISFIAADGFGLETRWNPDTFTANFVTPHK